MSFITGELVTVTTAADGSATAYTSANGGGVYSGAVVMVVYTKNNFSDGSTFTITGETTRQTIWAESNVNASTSRSSPLQAANLNTDGTTITGKNQLILLAAERIKIVLAQGGNTKTGTFRFIIA